MTPPQSNKPNSNSSSCDPRNRPLTAKFLPVKKSTTLPELVALRARLQQDVKDLILLKKTLRSSLAKKAAKLRKLAHARGVKSGAKTEKQAILKRIIEIDLNSKEIFAQSHQEALDTIEAICLAVFGQSIAIKNELLAARFTRDFDKHIQSSLSKVIVAKGCSCSLKPIIADLALIEESEDVPQGQAVLQTKSGTVEIDVMEDLKAAFNALNEKLSSTQNYKA